MKTILFAAALSFSGIALAQAADTTGEATEPTTSQTVAPGNAARVALRRGARGIPVVSDPAMAPAGANEPVSVTPGATVVPNPNQSAAFASQPAAEDYPACSRTVTDKCVQAYEIGVGNPD